MSQTPSPKTNTTSIIIFVVVALFCCCCIGLIASLGGGYFFTTSAIASTYSVDGEWEMLRTRMGVDGEWYMWKDLPKGAQNVIYELQTIEKQIQIKTFRTVDGKKQEKIGNTWLFKIDSQGASGIIANGIGDYKSFKLEYPYDNKQLIKLYMEGPSPNQPEPEPKDDAAKSETESAKSAEKKPEIKLELVTLILVPKEEETIG